MPAYVSRVSGVAPEPSVFATQTLVVEFGFGASLPSNAAFDPNASFLPSGDQLIKPWAEPVPAAVCFVRGMAPEPSALITQTLVALVEVSLPSSARLDRNASLAPSGENTG